MRTSMIAILATVGALATAPAMAQTTMPAPAPTDRPAVTAPAPATPPAAMAPAARRDDGNPTTGMRVSKIIGSTVRNSAGENVGSIDDLVVREKDQVVMAVLSVGGFLGIGDRKVAVPWSELTFGNDRTVTYNVTKDQLKEQPEYRG